MQPNVSSRHPASPQASAARLTFAAIPRTAWVVLGLGSLFAAAAVKLFVVDEAVEGVYPLVAFGGCLAWFGLVWALVGRLEVDRMVLRSRRRVGSVRELPLASVVRVEAGGDPLDDTDRVTLHLGDGQKSTFNRLRFDASAGLRSNHGRATPRGWLWLLVRLSSRVPAEVWSRLVAGPAGAPPLPPTMRGFRRELGRGDGVEYTDRGNVVPVASGAF